MLGLVWPDVFIFDTPFFGTAWRTSFADGFPPGLPQDPSDEGSIAHRPAASSLSVGAVAFPIKGVAGSTLLW